MLVTANKKCHCTIRSRINGGKGVGGGGGVLLSTGLEICVKYNKRRGGGGIPGGVGKWLIGLISSFDEKSL